MATICNITITSDIAPGFGGISESMTLTQAGNLTDQQIQTLSEYIEQL